MNTHKVDDRVTQATNHFHAYAVTFNISVAEAIAERDHPADVNDCIHFFKEATGREPSMEEIHAMRPDSPECVREFWAREDF